MSSTRKKIVIIGGGITGLSTAYFLQEKMRAAGFPIDCTLIEADSRFGGKVVTEQAGGFVIEGGPDSFITQKPWGLELCRKLGIADRLIQTHPTDKAVYVLSRGKLAPLPEGFNLMIPSRMTPFLLTPLISPFGKARMGLDLLIPRRESEKDESIASFVRRRLGEEALALFAEPILAGIYAGDAEKLSMQATFPQFAALERKHGSLVWGMWMQRWDAARGSALPREWSLFVTLRDGLSSLISALREKLDGVTLVSGQRVTEVSLKEGRYHISLPGKSYSSDAVVITANAGTAAGWIEGWDPLLAKRLREIQYVSTATVSLGYEKREVPHPLRGFGFVVPRREGRKIMASTWSSTKFSDRAPAGHVLIRLFLGGAHQEGLVDRDDADLVSIAREELRSILGIQAEPVVSKVFRWIKANPQYHVGHLERVDEIEEKSGAHPGLYLAGAAYRGVGIPDCIRQGMETAEKIVGTLSPRSEGTI